MLTRFTRFIRFVLTAALLLQWLAGAAPGLAAPHIQGADPEAKALALLEGMTPEERVGQLFLVTFQGNQAPPESRIYDLIYTHHIGGVVLERAQDNFVGAPSTLEILQSLVRGLQQAESEASQDESADPATGETFTPTYVPLLVGLSHEGDGYPNNQILSGLSPQPSAMTLGATWNPDLARRAGELLGSELSILGINLLLGPSLDVLDNPRPTSAGDIAARSFGGDPYWVGQMGQAYIEGIHTGSEDRVAVVAKHLPGYGGADRPLDEEIPTIRRSLSELAQIELVPFFSVTGDAPSESARADAMLMAHIRYQGFQGNIRISTRPVSFDPQAFTDLMDLETFSEWREDGGLIISDSLGTLAVRRSYEAIEQPFDGPLVARDAFLAGNDLLYLGNFVSSGDEDSYTTIVETVQSFAQKYREDSAFAERVDESVLRILTMKFRLYPTFNPSFVYPRTTQRPEVGTDESLVFEIGRQAATLLNPGPEEMPSVIPDTPRLNEQIVFIVDSYTAQQCAVCEEEAVISPSAFEQAAERLYGPGGSNQIAPGNVTSHSFRELTVALDEQPGNPNVLLNDLSGAEWVVFGMLKPDASRPDSRALERLLNERPELLQGKTVIVFALNAPYYLDSTDITKITAYYALYSKHSQMAELAARLLFQEISAPGASPVSVSGVAYNLIEVTLPDPARAIPLTVNRVLLANGESVEAAQETPTEGTPQATATPDTEELIVYQAGDLLSLKAGPIMDHNGHRVPDNTPVTFLINIATEGSPIQRQIATTTREGMAEGSYSIEAEGSLEIRAVSGSPEASSATLRFNVSGVNPEGIALQATQTAVAILQANSATEAVGGQNPADLIHDDADLTDWFLAVVMSVFVGLLAYQSGSLTSSARWGVRWALGAFIGGLVTTSYMGLGLPGTQELLISWGAWGIALLTAVGTGLGWLSAWLWKRSAETRG